jgi:ATP-dependent helicase/DNAse subunit B
LVPSRLLFAADRETVARRATRFFATPVPLYELPPLAGSLVTHRAAADFPIPLPDPLQEPIDVLRVTAFRDYLACRYRFYLRHVLHLQPVDDAAEELDGGTFGTLLHEVMSDFGNGPCRDSTDPGEIRSFFDESLSDHVRERFGDQPLATVSVQIEQLRQRLRAFAETQAQWANQGWQIELTETPPREQPGASFDVDGQPILLRGRIDRIDIHRETGERMILDYKSSDSGKKPDSVHRRGGEWVDLQLPLYRHLARSLGLEGPLGLGYILLPKDVGNVKFEIADWSPEDLNEADAVARDVVRRIRAEDFWPPRDPPPDFSEDLAPICQDQVFDKPKVD